MGNNAGKAMVFLVYINAFVIGFIIMGFEMVASRYMYPFFGGSIETWAALISTVLLALMAGYFTGGILADRFHTLNAMGYIIIAASLYITFIPLVTQSTFEALANFISNGTLVLLGSAMMILFVPIALFGIFTPYSIRLILTSTTESGKIAGRIYSISTLGNITGTLVTTFYLVPAIGSVNLTFLFSIIVFMSGLSFWIFDYMHSKKYIVN